MDKWLNARNRKWLYAVTIAVMAVLVGYDVVSQDQAPLWLGLVAAVLGVAAPVTAITHVTPDAVDDFPEDGHADFDGELS